MPLKFNKEVSSHLFKYIQKIDVKFNPFDNRATSARELMRQVQARRFAVANPKLKISVDVHDRPDKPIAAFHYIDGSEQSFETQSSYADEIMFQVHLKAMQMDAEYEMSGKSIDS